MEHQEFLVVLAAAAFIVNAQGEVLIIKKVPGDHIDAGLWTVPGGKIDPKESLIDGLKREVKEEVGFELTGHLEWLHEDVFTHGSNGIYYHAEHFLTHIDPTPEVILEPGAFTEYHWLTSNELNNYNYHPNMRAELIRVFHRVQA